MDDYLAMGVKSLIDDHPQIGEILDRYGIGCVPCTIGTCKLHEVVKMHALPAQDEAEMMHQIAKVIYPDRELFPPEVRAAAAPVGRPKTSFSPPVRRLVEEHTWIKRVLAMIPDMVDEIRASGEIDANLMRAAVDFIRGYADRLHHLKEEDILFDYVDRDLGTVQVILQDHERARGFVRTMVRAVEGSDPDLLCANLCNYRDLLSEHITKEDEILYPYIDCGLTTSQVGEIFGRFAEAEGTLDEDNRQEYERFVIDLEHRFGKGEAVH